MIETFVTFVSIFVTGFSLIPKDTTVKFNTYKEKGKNLRQNGKVARAVAFYRQALKYTTIKEQQFEIWSYIIYAHTDRLIAAAQEMSDDTMNNWMLLNWKWGPTNIPTDYVRPLRRETLK